jgi:hypothetical protein
MMMLEKLDSTCKRMKLDPLPHTLYAKLTQSKSHTEGWGHGLSSRVLA